MAHLDIGFVVVPEGKHNVEDDVGNRRDDRVLLSLSLIQRCKKATFMPQDPVEIEKHVVTESRLLLEIDNW